MAILEWVGVVHTDRKKKAKPDEEKKK